MKRQRESTGRDGPLLKRRRANTQTRAFDMGAARQAAKDRQLMLAMARSEKGELKGVDQRLTVAGPIIATTATSADSFVLNLIQEGSGSENRIGRKINLQSLRLKGLCELTMDNAATTGGLIPTPVRMVVVWDKQPSGSQPAFSTIFGIQDQTGTVSSDVFDPLKYTVTDRFQVLRDVIWTFNPMLDNVNGGTTDAVVYHKVFDEFINLKGKQSVYGASSSPSVVGDIQSGGLYVYFRAIYSVASTTSASISSDSWSRLRFLG